LVAKKVTWAEAIQVSQELSKPRREERKQEAARAARIASLKDAVVEAAKAVFVIYGGQREKMKALSHAVKALEQAEKEQAGGK
jgi:hypothetical protein